jgi:hypothetical protein
VNCSVNAAATSKPGLGSVHDSIYLLPGNIALTQFNDALVYGFFHRQRPPF